MPRATQAKLLRAPPDQEIQRVGSLATRKVDVRVIAATHRDLYGAINRKQFREDLYYRLAMSEIHAPRPGSAKRGSAAARTQVHRQVASQCGKRFED